MHRRDGDVDARVGFVIRVAARLLDSRGLERVALQHILEAAIVPLRLDSGGRVRYVERWYVDGGVGIHVVRRRCCAGVRRVFGVSKESAEAMNETTPLVLAEGLLLLLEPQRRQRLVVEQLGSLVRLDCAEAVLQ